jgi:hypothetical protein
LLSDREGDLRATAEDIEADAARLHAVESEKAGLAPGDPRAHDLAREAERLAKRLVPKTVAERELTEPDPEPAQ